MVIDYNNENPVGAQAVIDYAIEQKLYDPTGQTYDPAFTSPAHLYLIAQHYGTPRQGWVRPNDDEGAQRTLRALLASGYPVIVDVTILIEKDNDKSAHYVVVTGIDADGRVHIHDPYGPAKRKPISQTIDWDDFYWAWMNNSDEAFGGKGWWMILLPDWTGRR